MIGTTISHYKILEKLGEGGMGVVYKAQDTKLDRLVALKFLPEHVSVGSSDLERFTQEAKAAAGLNHPNICTIHGIEEAEGKNFIVMEFVDGQTLQEKKSSLSMKQALDVGIQIAEGLAAAHDQGIVHRDIKPENILLDGAGRVKVTDFGIARLVGSDAKGWTVTTPQVVLGTPHFMAPEAAHGAAPDPRMDVYSLGVLLYQMVKGRLPVGNFDPLPGLLDRIVRKALSPDPAKRFAGAEEMRRDLAAAKLLPIAEDLEPHEQQWMSAVALLQAISTAVALWALLACLTPKTMD